ncbi:MAG: hypothetical protein WBQ21_14785 [Solirubrobacteraceae bacterium]
MAVFTRPFIRQITGTPTNPFLGPTGTTGELLPGPTGVATDPQDNVWVSDPYSGTVDEFNSTGTVQLEIPNTGHFPVGGPEQVAVGNSAAGPVYLATNHGTQALTFVDIFDNMGSFQGEFGPFGGYLNIAVDNSTAPPDGHVGDVYVAETGSGTAYSVQLLDSAGDPVDFSGTAPYIEGNKLVGTPSNLFHEDSFAPWALATDPQGDIYVAVRSQTVGEKTVGVVDEFKPSGIFVRSFGPVGDSQLEALAVDPTNGHLLAGEQDGAVQEFDAEGHYLNTIGSTAAGAPLGSVDGLAVDTNGNLYVASATAHAVDAFGPGAFLPDLRVDEVSERKPTSAVLNGEVDPEGIAVSDCHFEYVSDAAFHATGFSDLSSGGEAPCVPAAASIPADASYHAVHAAVSGLTSGVTYHFRLVATSDPAQLGGTGDSAPLSFVAPHPPTVDSTSAANVFSSFADLHAAIDPMGADTTYQFEYVDAAHYDAGAQDPYAAGGVAPAGPVDIGSTGTDASVVQQVGGLLPDTMYHFRAVATNALGVADGPDETFATLPVGTVGLPDGRAYELVTPANKGDAEDMFGGEGLGFVNYEGSSFAGGTENTDTGYSSEDGNEFLLYTTAAFGPFPSSGEDSYVFSRGSSGWTYKSLASPNLGVQSVAAEAYDPVNFSEVGINDRLGVGTSEATSDDLVGEPGGPYTTLVSGEEAAQTSAFILGASQDLSHVVLASQDHVLAPGDSTQDAGSWALYEEVGGQLRLVNVNTNGSLTSRCGAVLGVGSVGRAGVTHNAVSSDGSKIFFTSPDPNASGFHCWNEGVPPELYMRVNGETTVEVSAPNPGVKDPDGLQPAVYVGASENGSRVFFITKTELTADDSTHDPELYEYDTETSTLTRISRGESGTAEGDVGFVPAISSDGSTVYFAAYGQLASGAPAVSQGGAEINLYRYDTNTGATRYIATVSNEDYPEVFIGEWFNHIPAYLPRPEVSLLTKANWYTTPDGRFLLFGSKLNITSYDSAGHTELYRYDSADGSIVCVSCDPNGSPPVSDSRFARSGVPGDDPAGATPRGISDDGSYVFFDTGESLVPQDTNGQIDVYEWHEGVISLISSGTESSASFFLDSSADGSNVFFGTHARLVPQDTDTSGDLYDARIGGGFGVSAGTGQCEGDACQNPQSAPLDQTPASLTFSGPGNPMSEPAPTVKAKVKTKTKKKKLKRKKKPKRAKGSVARGGRSARGARHVGTKGRAGR